MSEPSAGEERGPEYGPYGPPPDEISLVQLLNVLLRHRRKIVGAPLAVAALVLLFSVFGPSTYTTRVSFIPEAREGGGASANLSQLASQFGLGGTGVSGWELPQFYADLVGSRRILDQAVRTEYEVADGRGTLLEYYDVDDEATPEERVAAASAALGSSIGASTDMETGVVEISVTTGHPGLSRQVAQRLVELVNDFNAQTRQSQAAAQADFVEGRLAETRRELRAVEDSLRVFLEQNRRFENLPELRFEHDRLQRQVQLKQSIHNSLAQSYEQARIDQVRSTPVITVVEEPLEPTRPDDARLPLKLALGLVLGGMLGVFWGFGAEFMGRVPEDEPEEYETFEALRREAVAELKGAGTRIVGLVRRGDRGG